MKTKAKNCGECKHHDKYSCSQQKNVVYIASTHLACINFCPKNPTNGNQIRQMSNEELATLINDCSAESGVVCKYCDSENCAGQSCVDGILAWLNAPAGNDTNVPTNESEVNNGFAKCEYCGKTYRKKKKAQRFCSIKCKDKWWNRERSADSEYLHPHCEDNFNGDW